MRPPSAVLAGCGRAHRRSRADPRPRGSSAARARSARRSSSPSMPTDRRMQPVAEPARFARRPGPSPRASWWPGCATRLSTPPRDSASEKHSRSADELAHGVVTAVELERHDRAEAASAGDGASSCPGWLGQPRVLHPLHAGLLVQPLGQTPGRCGRGARGARAACAGRAGS